MDTGAWLPWITRHRRFLTLFAFGNGAGGLRKALSGRVFVGSFPAGTAPYSQRLSFGRGKLE